MDSSKAKTLRESVIVAQQALEKARVNYQRAFAILLDTGVNDDGIFALRRGLTGNLYQLDREYSSVGKSRARTSFEVSLRLPR